MEDGICLQRSTHLQINIIIIIIDFKRMWKKTITALHLQFVSHNFHLLKYMR